jgi:hypothetical protein
MSDAAIAPASNRNATARYYPHALVSSTVSPLRWCVTSLSLTSVPVASVDAQVPLSLLEAVRAIDQPAASSETEYVPELRNKRLGLSDTVYAQIRRYGDASRRDQRISREEAAGIARLLSRREDAHDVFRAAGQLLARASFGTLSPATKSMLVALPGIFTRPVALRRLRRLAERYLEGGIRRVGAYVYLTVSDAVAAENEDGDPGAVFYEAALREYVALLVGASGAVDCTRSARRGGVYEWRAEWRAAPPAERRALRAAAARG